MLDLSDLQLTKTVDINGKQVKIPKLSLYHHSLIKDIKDPHDVTRVIINSIHKGLTKAEQDLAYIHLLHFNDKLNGSFTHDGIEYTIDDIKITQKLKFHIDDYEFRFKTPTIEDSNTPIEQILDKALIWVKYKNEKIDPIPFEKMPAFVAEWAVDIISTVSIQKNGEIVKGLHDIVELFSD